MARVLIIAGVVVVLVVLIAGGSCLALTRASQPTLYTGAATEITAGPGETFAIVLDSNRTTGYQWQLGAPLDPAIVLFEGSSYQGAANAAPGAGGSETLTFRAIGRGTASLNLVYVRPWETGVAPARSNVVALTVR